MHFASPEFFLLLPALALAAWVWPKLQLFQPLRATILVLLTLALTHPSIQRQQDALDLFVLLDRSDSTEDDVDKNLPEWQKIITSEKPGRNDHVAWFNYAAEIAEDGSDGNSFTGSRKLTNTNLAISSIIAQTNPKRPARILLFTDGYSSEPLHDALALLKEKNIPLDYRLIRRDSTQDYRISRFHLPESAQSGEPFLISCSIHGPDNTTVPLTISRNGTPLTTTTVTLKQGTAVIEFTDRLPISGAFEYKANIRPEHDTHLGNNTSSRWIEIQSGPRIIVASHYTNDPLAAALTDLHYSVQTISNLSQLQPGILTGARAVIFNNVPAHEIPTDFLNAIPFFIKEQGGGFLMTGGKSSFGSGGYFQSAIDPILPVSMELKSEHRKLAVALAIILDRSGSMACSIGGGVVKMDLANSGACEAIKLLGPMDQIAVTAVDSEPTDIVKLTQIGKSQGELIQKISKIQSQGGGIFIYEGLNSAWNTLQKATNGTRHVILFADASDSEEPGNYKKLIADMTKAGCSISVIGLGTEHDCDAALLKDIAKLGNGRIFFSNQPLDIPKIFAQETVTIARSAFLTDPTPTLASGRWAEISPKPISWLKTIDGYNLSYAREDATVSLLSSDSYSAPLVAHSQRGLGRSAAISFPIAGEYSDLTRSWPEYSDFIQTMSRYLMGNDLPPGISLRHQIDGTKLTIDLFYDPETWAKTLSNTPPKIRLQASDTQTTTDVPWRKIAPGHFSVTRNLDEGSIIRGAVQVGPHALPFGPISVGSSIEWDFNPNRLTELRNASAQSGGRELTDLKQAWLRPPTIAETSLLLPITITLCLLILIEALLTRTGNTLPFLPKTLPALPKLSLPKIKRHTNPLPTQNTTPKPQTKATAQTSTMAATDAKPSSSTDTTNPPPASKLNSSLQRAKKRQ